MIVKRTYYSIKNTEFPIGDSNATSREEVILLASDTSDDDLLDNFPDLEDDSRELGPSFNDEALMGLYHRLHGQEGFKFLPRTGGSMIVFTHADFGEEIFYVTHGPRLTDSKLPWFFVEAGKLRVAFGELACLSDAPSNLKVVLREHFAGNAE